VWLAIAKAGSSFQTVSYAEAIEVALCFGWIDGQKRREATGDPRPPPGEVRRDAQTR